MSHLDVSCQPVPAGERGLYDRLEFALAEKAATGARRITKESVDTAVIGNDFTFVKRRKLDERK